QEAAAQANLAHSSICHPFAIPQRKPAANESPAPVVSRHTFTGTAGIARTHCLSATTHPSAPHLTTAVFTPHDTRRFAFSKGSRSPVNKAISSSFGKIQSI